MVLHHIVRDFILNMYKVSDIVYDCRKTIIFRGGENGLSSGVVSTPVAGSKLN
jgi:hypothetical protein